MKMLATIFDENNNELVTKRVISLECAFMLAEVLKSESKRIEIYAYVKDLFNEECGYILGNYMRDEKTNEWAPVSKEENLAEKYFAGCMR